jgi:hypothetical protein
LTAILGCEPNLIKLFVETHVRVMAVKKWQQYVDSQAQYFVICWFSTTFFLSYYFLESDEFIFSFQDTHNNQLKERYGDDPSTRPDLDSDLWLKA